MGFFKEIEIRGHERFQGAAEPAFHPPRAARDTAYFAESKGIKRDDSIRFSPLSTLQRDGGCLKESHAEWSIMNGTMPQATRLWRYPTDTYLYSGLGSMRYDTVLYE